MLTTHIRSFYGLALAAVMLTAVSCKKDKPDPQAPGTFKKGETVFVLNEGNFQFGNATVTAWNTLDSTVTDNVFEAANNRPLGDVAQSMTFVEENVYVVVNGSAKIEVLQMPDFKSTATITGFVSPRYMLPVSATKAYVSDLYQDGISIVNLQTNIRTGVIPLNGWSEEMLKVGNEIWVTNMEHDKVYIINPDTDQVTDSIQVSYASGAICRDTHGKIWVLCPGDKPNNIKAGLHRIAENHTVDFSLEFPAGRVPSHLGYNIADDRIYFIDGGIYRMSTTDNVLPTTAWIATNSVADFSGPFYNLVIGPEGRIFVTDPKDFIQKRQSLLV